MATELFTDQIFYDV